MSQTALRRDLEAFFARERPYDDGLSILLPAVSVDENLNHPQVTSQLFALLKEGYMLSAAWYDQRRGSDDQMTHVPGLRFPQLPPLSMGQPIPGTSWPDHKVIWNIVVQFAGRSTVFFLSENTRNDLGGIRRLLKEELAPILDADAIHPYSLAVLWKRGRTAHATYANKAVDLIRNLRPPPGYWETKI